MTESISTVDMRSRIARSMRSRPTRYWFSMQLADRAHPAVAEMVDVVDLAAPVLELDQRLDDRQHVVAAQHAHRVVGIQVEARVHLDAADRRQVVALGVEEQAVEQGLGRVDGRRLARAHHPVDVDERVLAAHVLVDRERVADIGADIDVVDGQRRAAP